jgi:hypothetical protein
VRPPTVIHLIEAFSPEGYHELRERNDPNDIHTRIKEDFVLPLPWELGGSDRSDGDQIGTYPTMIEEPM